MEGSFSTEMMEKGLAQSLPPSLLPILRQGWDRTDSYSFATALEAESSEPNDEDRWGRILPDELLERVLALLPVPNIFRAGAVCKRWNSIIASTAFLHLCEEVGSTSPWYFMFNEAFAGAMAYDPVAKKWHNLELPRIDTPIRFVASVNGLVCFMDSCNCYDLYICNPMTKATRKLPEPSMQSRMDEYSVSMTVNKATKVQTIVVARSDPKLNDCFHWTLSIQVYDSSSKKWKTTAQTLLHGWRSLKQSVICNGFFYCFTRDCTQRDAGMMHGGMHDLITYQLSSGVLNVVSLRNPCDFTLVGLMNCNNKLVMVGMVEGTGMWVKVKRISIWELVDSEWREVAKTPNLRNRGDAYTSSGSGDLIYIHAIGRPHLVLYDMSRRSWRGAQDCPREEKHLAFCLFKGFCFEPRLEACA